MGFLLSSAEIPAGTGAKHVELARVIIADRERELVDIYANGAPGNQSAAV